MVNWSCNDNRHASEHRMRGFDNMNLHMSSVVSRVEFLMAPGPPLNKKIYPRNDAHSITPLDRPFSTINIARTFTGLRSSALFTTPTSRGRNGADRRWRGAERRDRLRSVKMIVHGRGWWSTREVDEILHTDIHQDPFVRRYMYRSIDRLMEKNPH